MTNDEHRDWIEDALRADAREHAAAYVADDGFTTRVVAALPPAEAALPWWRKPAVAALWGLAGAGALLSVPDLAVGVGREAFRLLATQPISLPQMIAALAAVGVATWGAAAYALRSD